MEQLQALVKAAVACMDDGCGGRYDIGVPLRILSGQDLGSGAAKNVPAHLRLIYKDFSAKTAGPEQLQVMTDERDSSQTAHPEALPCLWYPTLLMSQLCPPHHLPCEQAFKALLLPTLALLAHKGLQDSVHAALAIPVYANVVQHLSMEKLADVYARFANGEVGLEVRPSRSTRARCMCLPLVCSPLTSLLVFCCLSGCGCIMGGFGRAGSAAPSRAPVSIPGTINSNPLPLAPVAMFVLLDSSGLYLILLYQRQR